MKSTGLRAVKRACFSVAAAVALIGVPRISPGQTSNLPATTESVAQPASAPAAMPARPLMGMLDQAGLASGLNDLNINLYGFVESSATWNAQGTHTNELRVFDNESRELDFNQLDMTIERTVDPSKGKFDVGGRMEWIWGSDAAFVHAHGLFDFYHGPENPDEQWDPVQAYIDFAIPIGNGLDLKVGRFVTLLGYETINPTNNPLYSHSYLFGYAIPFTHTGVLATYSFNDKWTASAGITRGWDQAFKDNNHAASGLISATWKTTDKLTLTFTNITGPELAGDSGHYRTVFDVIAAYTATEKLTLGLNADYGFEASNPVAGTDAQWFGTALYASEKINDLCTLNLRGEWFDDANGTRLAAPAPAGFGTNVYEITAGVTLTPFYSSSFWSNFKLRPEVRWDYCQRRLFDSGTEHNLFTAAVEGYFAF